MASSGNPARNQALDVLRGLAVVLVLLNHISLDGLDPDGWTCRLLRVAKRGGWMGVDLFFVLSGFLVASLIFREHLRHGSFWAGRFLVRRGFKIYPSFYLFLAVMSGWFVFADKGYLKRQFLYEGLFVQNYFYGLFNHTWSLAVEEHFYLGLTAVCALGAGISRRLGRTTRFGWIPLLGLVLAVMTCYWRWQRFQERPDYDFYFHSAATHLRVDSLMTGVLLAWVIAFRPALGTIGTGLWGRLGVGVGALSVITLPFFFSREAHPWLTIFGLPLIAGASMVLIRLAIEMPVSGNWIFRSIAWLGQYSYTAYLWHMVANELAIYAHMCWGVGQWGLYGTLYLGLTGLLAWFSGRLIEQPLLTLRDRLFRSRSTALQDRLGRVSV
jgi:peptidoglycan/LPS O-acetylase OafA/YrhL